MKKKWSVRALLVLLCMMMLCSAPAHATEVRASERIHHSTATLSKASNGNLSIFVSVRATGTMEKIGASSVEVQRKTITGWITEYTFNTSNTPALQRENRDQYSTVLTYSPLFTEKEYRAVVMIYVKDASGISTQQLISGTVIAS